MKKKDIKLVFKGADEQSFQELLDDLRPKGEWGPCYENPRNGKYYKDCSNCGEPTLTGDNNFCPNCGADMWKGGAE